MLRRPSQLPLALALALPFACGRDPAPPEAGEPSAERPKEDPTATPPTALESAAPAIGAVAVPIIAAAVNAKDHPSPRSGDPASGPETPRMLFNLYRDMSSQTQPCVVVVESSEREALTAKLRTILTDENRQESLPPELTPCHRTLDALRERAPAIHTEVRASNLAASLRHLGEGGGPGKEQVFTGDKLLYDFAAQPSPFDRELWRAGEIQTGPKRTDLREPTFTEDRTELTYDHLRRQDPSFDDVVVVAERVTWRFREEAWTRSAEPLPSEDHQARRVAEVERAVGGSVAGLLNTPLSAPERGSWSIALGPTSRGSAGYAWRDASGAVKGYAKLEALLADHPEIVTPPHLVAAAKRLNRHFSDGSFSVIADPDAYWREYEAEGHDSLTNKRYHQGTYYEDRVDYSIREGVLLTAPTLDGETLTVYLSGARNHQPYRVVFDLGSLTLGEAVAAEFLATYTTSPDPRDPEAEPTLPTLPTPPRPSSAP